jgi:hypothetical protein
MKYCYFTWGDRGEGGKGNEGTKDDKRVFGVKKLPIFWGMDDESYRS